MGFADPWEHVRLLSDRRRNAALLALLERRAPGARVLEVGCGTGLFACMAARLGASHVVAVEPTPMAEVARELVRVNDLEGRVEVRQALLEELTPEPKDLIFSELLNADPFVEGVVEVMRTAAAWRAPNGHLAPRRLDLWAAPVSERAAADEVTRALAALDQVDLKTGPIRRALGAPGPYRCISEAKPLTRGQRVLSIELGLGEVPDVFEAELKVPPEQEVGGVAVWWEALLDTGLLWSNRPGLAGHWGQLVCGWPRVRRGAIRCRFGVDEDGLEVMPL